MVTSQNTSRDRARPSLNLEDILSCDQSRCAYDVTVNETVHGPQAQSALEAFAGSAFVVLVGADTYSGQEMSVH
jgi:hypothetical protein